MEDFFDDVEKHRPSFFRRVYLWWKFEGRYYPQDFKIGIKKLIYWFPIIWKDRDWDGYYILRILQHKLKSQSKYIGNRNYHTRSQLYARNMRICEKLIQKILDDDYELEYQDYTKDRHWFEPIEGPEKLSTWKHENIWENYDEYFKKYPLVYKKVMNGEGFTSIEGREDDKHLISMCIANLNHQRAYNLLFKIMKEGIPSWWD